MKLPFETQKPDSSDIDKDEQKEKKDQNKNEQLHTKIEKIEITVYPNQREDVEKILHEFDIHYIKIAAETYETNCYHYTIFSPSYLTSELMNKLSSMIDTKQRIHVIAQNKIESSISDYFMNLFQSYRKTDNGSIKHIEPIERIISKTDDFLAHKNDVYIMVLIATIASFVGLIQNEVAIIIGGMLISPLIGPISSFSLNSVLGRRKQLIDSIRFIAKTIISAILIASAVSFIFSFFITIEMTPEISSRAQVNPLFIIFAILLGIAGGLALVTSFAESMTGVAIAVALVPPAAVVGIGLGTFSFEIALFSFLNLLANLLGIVIGFMVTFLIKKISPRKYQEKKIAENVLKKNIILIIGLAVLVGLIEIFLIYLKII